MFLFISGAFGGIMRLSGGIKGFSQLNTKNIHNKAFKLLFML
jgi:Na+/H+ antiporter NhaC